jgi:UDP-N-acetylmuramate: L-alanyl-gamma-D-glutamyl-meso-diaminopimelate ligase
MERVHFIAIGGSAMHNLALALHNKGYRVSGSDDEIFEPAKSRLEQYGLLPVSEGWFPEKIDPGLDAVILGMHAKADNPELLRAQELGVKVFSYPEYLYEQAKDKIRIVVGGSHGKTTITAMILHAMQFAGIETDYMVGAKLEGFDIMVRLSDSAKYMIFEGDEYLTSPVDRRPKFHLYQPDIALLSGIAWDHINVFPTFEEYLDQFRKFIRLTSKKGILIYCQEDAVLKDLCEKEPFPERKFPYSLPESRMKEDQCIILEHGKEYPVRIFGKHNLLNLNGAKQVCDSVGIAADTFWTSMATFKGASNRLELLGHNDQTRIYKDFAHAPSKVEATIKAVKEQFPARGLVACLELHTYSSLSESFLPHYRGSMEQADTALVYYNPHALQLKRLPDLSKETIAEGFDKEGIMVFNDSQRLKEFLINIPWRNTNLLLMSSGNFDGMNLDEIQSVILKR